MMLEELTIEKPQEKDVPHYVGHRSRLKEKFLSTDPTSFNDYEILELLLFQVIPRRDVKPLAKMLLKKFGSLKEIVNADSEQIFSIKGAKEPVYLQFRILKELISRLFFNNVNKQHVIRSWSALLEYLNFCMGSLKTEQFRTLFLNQKNILIADEVMAHGTVDQTPVYPREIVKRALFHEATAIILVHNHPSGNPKPSSSDIDLTAQIVNACKVINVRIHDHVIIGGNEHFSFKTNMLL